MSSYGRKTVLSILLAMLSHLKKLKRCALDGHLFNGPSPKVKTRSIMFLDKQRLDDICFVLSFDFPVAWDIRSRPGR